MFLDSLWYTMPMAETTICLATLLIQYCIHKSSTDSLWINIALETEYEVPLVLTKATQFTGIQNGTPQDNVQYINDHFYRCIIFTLPLLD